MNKVVVICLLFAVCYGAVLPDRPSGRVVGGVPVNITDVPYAATFRSEFFGYRCTGVIISEFFILTNAQCFDGFAALNFEIRVGSSLRNSGGIVHEAKNLHYHPQYVAEVSDYDAGLIELKEPIIFDEFAAPIRVADTPPNTGDMVTVSGWGAEQEGGPWNLQIHSVDIPVIDNKICADHWREMYTPRFFCAGTDGADSCNQDAGDPVVFQDTLVAVPSFGIRCGEAAEPRMYTNIADPGIREFIRVVAKV